LYYDKEQVEYTRKNGEVIIALNTIKGINTKRFKDRWVLLNKSKVFVLGSENTMISKYGRWVSAQKAYELLQTLSLLLSQDTEDLGLNKKDKTPGSAAALTGT